MVKKIRIAALPLVLGVAGLTYGWFWNGMTRSTPGTTASNFDASIAGHASSMLDEGRRTFRFDTFGDEAFWGDALKIHQAIEGAALGGVGPGLHGQATVARRL